MTTSILMDVKNAAKGLIDNGNKTKIKKIPTLNETVDSIMNATNPARKAHATRRLKAYAVHHARAIGSTPTRVIAGVAAAVTKKMQNRRRKVA